MLLPLLCVYHVYCCKLFVNILRAYGLGGPNEDTSGPYYVRLGDTIHDNWWTLNKHWNLTFRWRSLVGSGFSSSLMNPSSSLKSKKDFQNKILRIFWNIFFFKNTFFISWNVICHSLYTFCRSRNWFLIQHIHMVLQIFPDFFILKSIGCIMYIFIWIWQIVFRLSIYS